ncbi:phosphoserine phosphatase serb [Gonapodya prolifera JEL478]|uniref:phosphoserine phosphatase n=1 Tax=Gonapodya prolifera (strain JEL478) TaxID=1344416 RepID=A0A139AUB8_GONPJ|nr:phosphoserine phosphatase serb [Gonapodya prolifera JEL478]|eukprot:KXS20336.1 phosphoserine phosphatase serb [Gonapodya prolifera JEL478]
MAFLRSKNISVDRLKRLRPAGSRCDEFHLSVPSTLDLKALRKDIYTISKSHRVDVALQPSSVFRRQRRVAVFDMDSTLIRQEVIDEIARKTGVVDQVAKITEAAMNGEIDFKESLRRRVALLKGTSATVFEEVRKELVFTDGAKELCACLKRLGFRTAVISGGFVPLAKYVKYYLGLDYAFANTLAVSEDGKVLTGEVVGDIVDAERKAQLLEVISQAEEVTLDQVIAVGDGANDLPMLGKAGLGIAFNAKPRVQEQAATRINQPNLLNVLYLLGYSDEEVNQLIQSVKRYD